MLVRMRGPSSSSNIRHHVRQFIAEAGGLVLVGHRERVDGAAATHSLIFRLRGQARRAEGARVVAKRAARSAALQVQLVARAGLEEPAVLLVDARQRLFGVLRSHQLRPAGPVAGWRPRCSALRSGQLKHRRPPLPRAIRCTPRSPPAPPAGRFALRCSLPLSRLSSRYNPAPALLRFAFRPAQAPPTPTPRAILCASSVIRGSCHRVGLALLRFALRPGQAPPAPRPRAIRCASRVPHGATRGTLLSADVRCRSHVCVPSTSVAPLWRREMTPPVPWQSAISHFFTWRAPPRRGAA